MCSIAERLERSRGGDLRECVRSHSTLTRLNSATHKGGEGMTVIVEDRWRHSCFFDNRLDVSLSRCIWSSAGSRSGCFAFSQPKQKSSIASIDGGGIEDLTRSAI